MKKNNFLYLIVTAFLLNYFSNILLDTDTLKLSSLAEQFTNEQIEEILGFQKKWKWITFFFIPIILFLKVFIIAAILDVGCFFFEKEIKYKKLFNIVVKAEFVFLGIIIFKTAWFYFFQPNYTLEDLQYFYPLSALNIIGYQDLETWFIYPFQVLNLFELTYWFVLAYLISEEVNSNLDKAMGIVASSYGAGLLIWVIGVMFLTLNMS